MCVFAESGVCVWGYTWVSFSHFVVVVLECIDL